MPSTADIHDLLRRRRPGFSLEQPFYTDPAIYALDMQAIFGATWLFAAATCELPNAGDWLTVPVGDASVIVLRDREETLRAFHNTCRHRGTRLCDAARGHGPTLVCPYHKWTYRLSGELANARYMGPEFDPAEHGLTPVHLRTVAGTIYICLAADPPDFTPFAEAVSRQLAPHALETAKLAAEVDLIENGNWKMVMENSRECYHCATGHRELMRTFLDIYDFANPGEAAEIEGYWARCEAAGVPGGVAEGPDFRANRLPLTNGARSITMDGGVAVARPLGRPPRDAFGSLRWVHYPSTFNHALNDYAVLVRMLPIGPEQTLVTTKFLVSADAVEGLDYDVARLTHVWNETNNQDRVLVGRNQLGVRSPGYRPGPYSRQLESGIIKFVEWYSAKLADHLLPARSLAAE